MFCEDWFHQYMTTQGTIYMDIQDFIQSEQNPLHLFNRMSSNKKRINCHTGEFKISLPVTIDWMRIKLMTGL